MLLPAWPLGKLELWVATGWRSNVGRVRSISSFIPSITSRSPTTVAAKTAASQRSPRHASHAATPSPPPSVAKALPAWVMAIADKVSPGDVGAHFLELVDQRDVERRSRTRR